jgi:zinc D-Ala-D-Ala carboxypeptidase
MPTAAAPVLPQRFPTRYHRLLALLAAASVLVLVPVLALPRGGDLTHLDPALRSAVRRAQRSGALQGHRVVVTSGLRSAAHQQALLDAEIRRRGSYQAAVRWVLPPDQSRHVRGEAVDIGPADGAAWLEREGWRWGLCRRFVNEPWHFELRSTPGTSCPPMAPDAASG